MTRLTKRFPIYSRLIGLYPEPYRRRYGREMLQTTADMLDGASSATDRLIIWSKLVLDLPLSIGYQQMQYIGGIMHNETPDYIKRNSIIAAVMLVPFFTALAANGLDKAFKNSTLQRTWLWHAPVLAIWVLRLPELALLLAIVTYARYVSRSKNSSGSWMRRLFDLRHTWPIVLAAALAFAILGLIAFHDSVQCWAHSPAYLSGHLSRAWQCTNAQSALHSRVFLW